MIFADPDPFEAGRASTFAGRLVHRLHVDGPLFVGLLLLAATGLFVLYSASGQQEARLYSQVIRLSAAVLAMLVFAQIPPKILRLWAPWLYLSGIVLLLLVLLTGVSGKGAQRWLDLGIVRFQPAEIMKLAVPMMGAWYLHQRKLPPGFVDLVKVAVIVIVPTVLIARQPDLGTALLIAASGILVVLLAGMSWKYIALVGGFALGGMPVLWHFMRDYQKQRVLTFLNPENDPLGAGYHIIQSKIAIGSGGIFGKGWLGGSQSHLEFLPERSTDFIFAVMGEEFGLLGLLFVLSLYLFVVGRGLYIAVHGQDTFSRLLAGSISLTFFVYVIVNSGMVTGLLPVVGVPLPLISYGGTSMVTLMAGFGMLMSIHTHRKLLPT